MLAGDVLGMPRDLNDAMMVATKDQDEADEEQIAFGFTFDGDEWHTAGTALEIVAMELNYLNASPLAWHRDADGIMTTGLGQDAIMMIVPKNKEYTLVRLDRDGWNYNHTVEEKGDIETVQTKADDIALEANMFLAGRSSRWRNDQPSDKQVAYLTKIAKKAGVKVPSDLNKGTCAELITHCQALLWLKTIRAQKGWA